VHAKIAWQNWQSVDVYSPPLLDMVQPSHPGLLCCCAYSCLQEGDRVVMVQEYADGGDLFNLLQKYGGCLSERIAVQMVLDPFLRVLQVRKAGYTGEAGMPL
jgi:hypothetical protein